MLGRGSQLEARGFKTEEHPWSDMIRGEKSTRLNGTETIPELQAIAKEMVLGGKIP